MSLDDEQCEILQIIDAYCKELGKGWNKFKGDVVCRIVKEYIRRHISPDLKVVGPSVYLEGVPNEFDLLIVDALAKPKKLTASFEPASVHYALEVKKGGVYGPDQPKRISSIFDLVTSKHPHIKCAYLTAEEVHTIKKPLAKNFFQISKDELNSHGHGFFALRDLRGNKQPIPRQWKKFLDFIDAHR